MKSMFNLEWLLLVSQVLNIFTLDSTSSTHQSELKDVVPETKINKNETKKRPSQDKAQPMEIEDSVDFKMYQSSNQFKGTENSYIGNSY